MVEHRTLNADAVAEVSAYAGEAKKLLGLWLTRKPRRIVTVLNRWIDQFRKAGASYDEERLGGAAIRFGCLWGDAVVREYGWQWLEARHDGDEDSYFVIVPPNRGYVIYPVVRAFHWLTDEEQPNTLLLFDTLASLPPAPDNEYVDLG